MPLMLSFLLIPASGFAQETWTLKQCIQHALNNNLQLQQLKLTSKTGELDYRQSKNNFLPIVNGSAAYGYNFGRALDPTTYSFSTENISYNSLGLNASLDLFNGFQNKNTLKQNAMQMDLNQLNFDATEDDIALAVCSAYLQVILAEEQEKVLREQAELTIGQKSQMEKMVRAGTLAQGDLLDLDAQMANEQLSIVTAQNAVATAYQSLQQLMEYYPDEPFLVDASSADMPSAEELATISADRVYESAASNRPEIKAAELQSRIAEQQIAVANGAKYPQLSLVGNLRTNATSVGVEIVGNEEILLPLQTTTGETFFISQSAPLTESAGFPQQWSDNFNSYVGLNLNIPIFNQGRVNTSIKRAEMNMANTHIAQKQSRNQLRNEINNAYLAATAAAKSYEASKSNIAALKQAFDQAEKKLNLGMINTFEYNTAKNRLAVAELNQSSARMELIFRVKILDFYQGKELY